MFPQSLKSIGSSDGLQIVDSIMALFRTDFSGRGELSERQQKVRLIFIHAAHSLICYLAGAGMVAGTKPTPFL